MIKTVPLECESHQDVEMISIFTFIKQSQRFKAGVKLYYIIDATLLLSPTTSLFFQNNAEINNLLHQQC